MKRVSALLVMVFGWVAIYGQVDSNFISIDQPVWEQVLTPAKGPDLSTFAESNGRMWTSDSGLEYSDDGGQTWQRHPISKLLGIREVFAGDFGVIFTRTQGTYPHFYDNINHLFYISTDGGNTFNISPTTIIPFKTITNRGGSNSLGVFQKSPTELIQIRHIYEFGSFGYALNHSSDGGHSWDGTLLSHSGQQISTSKFSVQRDTLSSLFQNFDIDSNAYITYNLQIYTQDYESPTIHTFEIPEQLALSVSNFHFQDGKIIVINESGHMLISSDLGQTWNSYINNISDFLTNAKITFGLNEIFVKTHSKLYTIDYYNPEVAELIFEAPPNEVFTYAESTTGILVSMPASGIFFRATGEEMFVFHSSGVPGIATDFKIAGTVLWAKTRGTWNRSEDQGFTWSPSPLPILNDSEILADHNGIFILEKKQ